MKKMWNQWNLYYHGNLDEFISTCIKRIVQECKKREDSIEWFFIRYWTGGPHVRLRFKTGYEKDIDDTIREAMKRHCDESKVQEIDKRCIAAQQEKLGFLEGVGVAVNDISHHGSIRRLKYIPENEKYGFGEILKISEWHFCCSSEYVIKVLQTQKTTSQKYTNCINSILEYFRWMNYDRENMIFFLSEYEKIWLNYLQISQKNWIKVLQSKGEQQIESIISYLHSYLQAGSDHENDPLMILKKQNNDLIIKLEKYFGKANYLNQNMCSKVLNYMHVHNNRLGIQPTEEVYISSLLKGALIGMEMGNGGVQ